MASVVVRALLQRSSNGHCARTDTEREERERERTGGGAHHQSATHISYAPRFRPSSLRTSFCTPQFLSAPRFHPSSLTEVFFRTSNSLRPSFATLHYILRTSVSSFLHTSISLRPSLPRFGSQDLSSFLSHLKFSAPHCRAF